MNFLVPEVPMSPKLIKCSSDSSIEYNDEDRDYDDIEEVIDKLMKDVCCSFEKPKRQIYKYVKILQNQKIIFIIINIIYYIFSKYNLIEYQRFFKVNGIFCMIDRKLYKLNSGAIKVFDNCFQLNKNLKIPYEFVKTVDYADKYIEFNLIPNERNITKIMIETSNDKYIFNKISSNMNYHVRYHKLNHHAIKYYQKLRQKPLEFY